MNHLRTHSERGTRTESELLTFGGVFFPLGRVSLRVSLIAAVPPPTCAREIPLSQGLTCTGRNSTTQHNQHNQLKNSTAKFTNSSNKFTETTPIPTRDLMDSSRISPKQSKNFTKQPNNSANSTPSSPTAQQVNEQPSKFTNRPTKFTKKKRRLKGGGSEARGVQ